MNYIEKRESLLLTARDIAAGKACAKDALELCLSAIGRSNEAVNAIVTLEREAAMKKAGEADSRRSRGESFGPLHGIPFTVKDNIETAGIRTTASHPPLKDRIPAKSATVVARLEAAGAILLGKTNLPELAMDSQTDSPLFGRTNNPWDISRTPGGSCGGSAAAVASGMSFFDIGNDFLGSGRIPAHYCGVAALVPSYGSVPRTGLIPKGKAGESVSQLPRMAFLGNSIAELGLLLGTCRGPDGEDLHSLPLAVHPLAEASGGVQASRRLRVLISPDSGGLPVSRDTAAALEAAAAALRSNGHSAENIDPGDFDFSLSRLCLLRLFYPAIGSQMPPLLRLLAEWFGGMRFLDQNLGHYIDAEDARAALIASLDSVFDRADVLISPVCSTTAFPHRKPSRMRGPQPIYARGIDVDGREVDYGTANLGFTVPFSLTGNPIAVIRMGSSKEGLPIGVQIVGRRFAEDKLLADSLVLEEIIAGVAKA